jgi:hypothetical protein
MTGATVGISGNTSIAIKSTSALEAKDRMSATVDRRGDAPRHVAIKMIAVARSARTATA